jgi:nitrite reductase/ring-hydroxylating ferredoxin subunit
MTLPTQQTFTERGFPYHTFPRGWFQACWSHELSAGDVVPKRFFAQDIVLYRSADGDAVGTIHALDAFCPHMGAHLGYGGTVENDCLRCPYHGWMWGPDGANVDIPYGDRPSINARTRAWHIAESAGAVYIWHCPNGHAPAWGPPQLPEDSDPTYFCPFPWAVHSEPMYMHPQFAAENFPDLAHMRFVHRWESIPDIALWREEGPVLRVDYDGVVSTSKGSVAVSTENIAYGVGVNINRVRDGLRSTTMGCFTPIDQVHSQGFITVWVGKRDPDAVEPDGLARSIAQANTRELFGPTSDRRVWENQRYRSHPLLVGYEATYTRRFRAWSAQFYPEEFPSGTAMS